MEFRNIPHIIVTLVSLLMAMDNVNSLRDVRVKIPHAVRRGEKAILKCYYDLEGDSLYSVKWYKGRREFYSFTPKETPAMKVFQFTGVKVERSASNESQLVLESVNLATTGKYSCEVSADAPSFHTLISAGEMEIVEVPGKDPLITGIRPRYKVGDIVRGNCTARHSKPAANLTWTVNGYETIPSHIRHHKPLKDSRELETAISGIHFVITPQNFIFGKLKIRCTAHIHDVYWKSTEKSIEEDRHRHGNSINLVNNFSEDYFDMDDGNQLDRSDTYMTHIKGDVSSLNANSSGLATCHRTPPLLTRFTVFALFVYTIQRGLLQLLQVVISSCNWNNTKGHHQPLSGPSAKVYKNHTKAKWQRSPRRTTQTAATTTTATTTICQAGQYVRRSGILINNNSQPKDIIHKQCPLTMSTKTTTTTTPTTKITPTHCARKSSILTPT